MTLQNVFLQINGQFWFFCPLHIFFISMAAAWVAENIYIIILHREMHTFFSWKQFICSKNLIIFLSKKLKHNVIVPFYTLFYTEP